MNATVEVAARADQVDTRVNKSVLVKLSFFLAFDITCNLVLKTYEIDASASSFVAWDLLEGISVLDVVVLQ